MKVLRFCSINVNLPGLPDNINFGQIFLITKEMFHHETQHI